MEQQEQFTGKEHLEEVFNWLAPTYDIRFTDQPVGKRQRHVVHRRLFPLLRPDWRVLELNCGTGHDAVAIGERCAEVVATDISPEMIRITSEKAAASIARDRIQPRRMAIEELQSAEVRASLGKFDLIFSDFDGLNCVEDLSWLPEAAEALLNPGGHIMMVYMSPVWLPLLVGFGKLKPNRELQRVGRDKITWHFGEGHTVMTWFHRLSLVRSVFAGRFDLLRTEAVRLVAPPPVITPLYARHPFLFDKLDDLLCSVPPFNRMGERVLFHMRLKRRPGAASGKSES